MKVRGESKRIPIKYKRKVYVKKAHRKYLWDCDDRAPLEKYILRIFQYGNFDDLKYICSKFPVECKEIVKRYKIKGGIKVAANRITSKKA